MEAHTLRTRDDDQALCDMESSPFQSSTDYDVVCIGFGVKALALAAALADHDPSSRRVLILERRDRFDADIPYVSPASPAGSSFLRDVITLRNPRSEFTFVNFLHSKNLLVGFTNASQMNPPRPLVEQYMAWVADKIRQLDWVAFGKEAVRVKAVRRTAAGPAEAWTIDARDCRNGSMSTIHSKRVVVASGNSSDLPEPMAKPELSQCLHPMHRSAGLLETVAKAESPLSIAILGADQQAAELMEGLHSAPGQHRATMIFPGSALRVEDSTPFSQEIVDGAGSTLHHLPPELRQKLLASSVSATYPTINLDTLESLYATKYAQTVKQADASRHRFQMRPLSELVSAQPADRHSVRLTTRDTLTGVVTQVPGTFDIVVASGANDNTPAGALLKPVSNMFGGGSLLVDSEYRVNFRRGALAQDCGIWILGSLVDRNARRDNFTLLAQVAGRALESIERVMSHETVDATETGEMARL